MKKPTYTHAPSADMLAEFLQDPGFKARWDSRANQRHLKEQIVEARIKYHANLRQLADRLGVSQATLSRVESGTYIPSIAILTKIAAGLGKKLEIRFVD